MPAPRAIMTLSSELWLWMKVFVWPCVAIISYSAAENMIVGNAGAFDGHGWSA